MQTQSEMIDVKFTSPKGDGRLEAALLVNKYIKLFGKSNNKPGSFMEEFYKKWYNKIISAISLSIAFVIALAVTLSPVVLFWLFPESFDQDPGLVMLPIVLCVAAGLLSFLGFSSFFKGFKYWMLDKNYANEKHRHLQMKRFLKEFDIVLNDNMKSQKESVYLYLNWVNNIFEKFDLTYKGAVKSAYEKFKYWDEEESGYNKKVHKSLLEVTDYVLIAVAKGLIENSYFYNFWKNERDNQFDKINERSQFALMEKARD